jgi:hypothetical protein
VEAAFECYDATVHAWALTSNNFIRRTCLGQCAHWVDGNCSAAREQHFRSKEYTVASMQCCRSIVIIWHASRHVMTRQPSTSSFRDLNPNVSIESFSYSGVRGHGTHCPLFSLAGTISSRKKVLKNLLFQKWIRCSLTPFLPLLLTIVVRL